jgi:virulence plasmid B protein
VTRGESERKEPVPAATASSSANGQIATPTLSLPKGGGAVRGIGEKFSANPATGTSSMTVPIAVSPGRSGFTPQLSLSYDSGAGNGVFGLGWALPLASITRKTDKGLPQYQDADESDVFLLSGAEDLVPVLVHTGLAWAPEAVPDQTIATGTYVVRRYRPRVEGLFARIERWSHESDPGDVFWRSISRDNVTTWYGRDTNSRIFDPDDPTHIYSWLVCESRDDKGNAIAYEYAVEDSRNVALDAVSEAHRTAAPQLRTATRHIKYIRYGNRVSHLIQPDLTTATWLFEVVFDYGEGHYAEDAADADGNIFASVSAAVPPGGAWAVRDDPFSSRRAGFETRTYRLCRRVLVGDRRVENVLQNGRVPLELPPARAGHCRDSDCRDRPALVLPTYHQPVISETASTALKSASLVVRRLERGGATADGRGGSRSICRPCNSRFTAVLAWTATAGTANCINV